MNFVMFPELEAPEVLFSAHAVARREDGTLSDTTECRKRAFFRPDETPMPWPASHPYKRCRECAKATGFQAANEDTGEFVPGHP
jgi:hypothetical protein